MIIQTLTYFKTLLNLIIRSFEINDFKINEAVGKNKKGLPVLRRALTI